MQRILLRTAVAFMTLTLPFAGPAVCQTSTVNEDKNRTPGGRFIEETLSNIRATDSAYLCDSYHKDNLRVEHLPNADLRDLARRYHRTLIRRTDTTLFRHDRWYDLAFAAVRTKEGSQRPTTLVVKPVAPDSSAKRGQLLEIRAIRTPIATLVKAVGDALDEPHRVELPLRVRRVTVLLDSADASTIRKALTSLYPDSEWVQSNSLWTLREKPEAALIRELARRFAETSHKDELTRLEEALKEEVVGSLDTGQLAALKTNGQLDVGWSSLSGEARNLFVQFGQLFQEVADRSGGGSAFADLSRVSDLGVEVFSRSGGRYKFEFHGRNRQGTRVVW